MLNNKSGYSVITDDLVNNKSGYSGITDDLIPDKSGNSGIADDLVLNAPENSGIAVDEAVKSLPVMSTSTVAHAKKSKSQSHDEISLFPM